MLSLKRHQDNAIMSQNLIVLIISTISQNNVQSRCDITASFRVFVNVTCEVVNLKYYVCLSWLGENL